MSETGRSLELFFIDGRPDGNLTAELFNWTGHVLRTPRTQIAKALARPEAGYTGVYILLGENDDAPLAYIGEAEDMSGRLKSHVSGANQKDWWYDAVLITTSADSLHKANVKYLESRLVEIAISVGQTPLDNGNQPTRSSLSEAATANMEAFIDTLSVVLPAIRVDMFLSKARPAKVETGQGQAEKSSTFTFSIAKAGITATARMIDGELVVQAGSQARAAWVGSTKFQGYPTQYDNLKSQGTLVPHGDHCVFTDDYAFKSPSGAAAVVSGRSANGRTPWVLPNGKTFAEWEAESIGEVEP